MKNIIWHIEKRKPSQLKGYEKNPRQISTKQFEYLKKSIKKFGYVEIVAINTDNMIIAGHQRVKALIELGRGEEPVEVRVPERKLTREEFREYLIRSNKNTGEWGFKEDELDFFDDVEVQEDDFDAEKEYAKIKKPQTQLEDIYCLNNHRLICGDCMESKYYETLINGKKPRLIFTDPPYNVDYESLSGHSYGSGKYGNSGSKIFNDDKKPEECLEFYKSTLQNLLNFSSDDACLYWWFANKNFLINETALKDAGWYISQVLIWVKEHFVFARGQDYHRCYEPVMFGWKKGKKHFTNKKISNSKDVFSLDFDNFIEMLDLWFVRRDNTNEYLHPTQKPVRLGERAIKKNSTVKDSIIDVFAGSGSTLIAGDQLNRSVYLMELDPKFCDVIIIRYIKFCK